MSAWQKHKADHKMPAFFAEKCTYCHDAINSGKSAWRWVKQNKPKTAPVQKLRIDTLGFKEFSEAPADE